MIHLDWNLSYKYTRFYDLITVHYRMFTLARPSTTDYNNLSAANGCVSVWRIYPRRAYCQRKR